MRLRVGRGPIDGEIRDLDRVRSGRNHIRKAPFTDQKKRSRQNKKSRDEEDAGFSGSYRKNFCHTLDS
jgi:hypothetical protein